MRFGDSGKIKMKEQKRGRKEKDASEEMLTFAVELHKGAVLNLYPGLKIRSSKDASKE